MNKNIRNLKKLIGRRAFIFALVILCCFILSACSYFQNSQVDTNGMHNDNLIVHYLDVGQGDSIFIELPNYQTMLIDAGVKGLGEGIKSYINDLGYSKIDYVIATHPHADHIGSMQYIVENMDIGQIYMPDATAATKTFEKLLIAISEKSMKIKSAESGMSIVNENNLSIDVLGPVNIDEDNLNNCSVVIKIIYKDNSFLFIGDAEKDELSSLNGDLSANVLKVGHHGSNTSTTKKFIEQVDPQIAVISVGKHNEYDHPNKKTIKLLNNFDIEIHRTDEEGTIIISSDGYNITTKTGGQSIAGDE